MPPYRRRQGRFAVGFVPLSVPVNGTNEKRPSQTIAVQQLATGVKGNSGEDGFRCGRRNHQAHNELRKPPVSFGTETGTLQDENGSFPPDLRAVIEAWPDLPDGDRQAVLAIVKEATRAALAE